jgi:hypothetical protein
MSNTNSMIDNGRFAVQFVFDADTGGLLKTFTTARAVVADVTLVPSGSGGLAILAYAVDLGGNIYRVDMGSNAPSGWTMTQIASLGCSNSATCAANRKFMFAADAVLQNGIYTLLLGSGDREKPLLYTSASSKVNSVSNYFFAVQDIRHRVPGCLRNRPIAAPPCSASIPAPDLLDYGPIGQPACVQKGLVHVARLHRAGGDFGHYDLRHDLLQHAPAGSGEPNKLYHESRYHAAVHSPLHRPRHQESSSAAGRSAAIARRGSGAGRQ